MRIYGRIHKRILGLLAAMVLLLCLPVYAFAAGKIDLDHDVSLTVSYQENGVPLTGVEFSIFLVATVDEYGTLTTTEDFSGYHIDIQGNNDEAWKTLADTLEGYVLRDQVSPTDIGKTDKQGRVSFPTGEKKLTPGLYLVLGARHTQSGKIYDAQPSMVLLPTQDQEANAWDYDVIINPKYESQPEPGDDTITRKVLKVWKDEGHEKDRPKEITVQLLRDGEVCDTVTLNAGNNWRYTWNDLDAANQWTVVEKEPEGYTVEITREGITFVITNTCVENPPGTPDKPDKPNIPQTGQLWWPVPILFAVGLLLTIFGLLRRRGNGHEE